MRIRQVKPSFWVDHKLAPLNDETRLFYIGVWMLADDAGWFRWSVHETAAALYPYLNPKARERKVERALTALSAMEGEPKLVLHECGHAHVPKLAEHQRVSNEKRVLTYEREHLTCPPRLPAGTLGEPRIPSVPPPGKVGKGKEMERDGSASAREATPSKMGPERTTVDDESKDPDADRKARIGRALAIINDPSKSETLRQAAHDELNRLGYAA